MNYTADFETTTDPNDCRIWAYAIMQIDNHDNFIYGNSMDDFIAWFSKNPSTLYFHNLKFDGEFIISWLFNHGYTWCSARKYLTEQSFTTLISDKGQFYSMEICFKRRGTKLITGKIIDSLKILPFSVENLAEGFGLPISKLKIDYDEYRPIGHTLTIQEIDYIRNDVEIVAYCLKTLFDEGLQQITQGSNALYDFKRIFTQKRFNRDFPQPYYDKDIRQAYKGGYTYLKPEYRDKDLGEGIVLDVNSLYPSVLYDELMPFGEGCYFEGEYQNDTVFPIYVQALKCQFELKDGYLPTIQVKNNFRFTATEYLTSSKGNQVTLYLTNIDLKLFKEHYEIWDDEYIDGWKFRAVKGLFCDYIDKWMSAKIEAGKQHNKPKRQLAKLMLNALYGKFALNPNVQSKIPYLDDNGVVKYKPGDLETRDPIYLPIGIFTTSYARFKTISTAQSLYDRFVYSDTDSLHLLGTALPDNVNIDKYRMGAWDHEKTFKRARFIRSKCYIEEVYNDNNELELEVTVAGLPEKCYTEKYENENGETIKKTVNVTWENFHPKAIYHNKLKYTHVPGGIVLEPIDFTIKI